MFIEIRGAGFVNKGAELMFHAVLQNVGAAVPDASFVMAPQSASEYAAITRYRVLPKLWHQRFRVEWSAIARLISQGFRRRYGLILDSEIDVVLDASGFAYTDQWGEKSAFYLAKQLKKWKRRGTRVVLMPQAMGPFSTTGIRKWFGYVLRHADLVFARDKTSYEHAQSLLDGESANLFMAPDFTSALQGIPPENPELYIGRFCLVPNFRMMDKAGSEANKRYVPFCTECLQILFKHGAEPLILVHDFDRDLELAEVIVRQVGQEIDIVAEDDALRIKGILGLCSGIIGSRYHALISALNQGRMALATSWSHKYEMLLIDYGIPDCSLSPDLKYAELERRLEYLIDPVLRAEYEIRIADANTRFCQETEEMWSKVLSIISPDKPSIPVA